MFNSFTGLLSSALGTIVSLVMIPATILSVLTLLSYLIPPPTDFTPYILTIVRPLALLNPILPIIEIMIIMKWTLILITGYTSLRMLLWLAGFINPQFNFLSSGRSSIGSQIDLKGTAISKHIQGR